MATTVAATVDKGDLARCTGSFTDSNDSGVDPSAVYFKATNPLGVQTISYQYGVDDELVRSAAGVYYVDVNANVAGRWHCLFYSTGTGQAAEEVAFDVDDTVN